MGGVVVVMANHIWHTSSRNTIHSTLPSSQLLCKTDFNKEKNQKKKSKKIKNKTSIRYTPINIFNDRNISFHTSYTNNTAFSLACRINFIRSIEKKKKIYRGNPTMNIKRRNTAVSQKALKQTHIQLNKSHTHIQTPKHKSL